MDLFKKANNKTANSLDWNCTKICKRKSGDTKILHKIARIRLKREVKEELEEK